MSRGARARATVLCLFGGVIVILTAWHGLSLSGPARVIALLATVVPLVLPLPGLVRAHRHTYRWATLTLVPAMIWALTELIANPEVRAVAAVVGMAGFLALAALVAALRTFPAADPAPADVSAPRVPRAPAGR